MSCGFWQRADLDLEAKLGDLGSQAFGFDLDRAAVEVVGAEILPTSNSTIYNLLARHGWRKLMPRPFHPKRNLAAQNAFKKTAFQML
jgi:Winged helix-turn helix